MGIKRFVTAFLFISGACVAQTDTITNAYHKEFKNVLAIQAFTLSTANNFTLDYTADNTVLELEPNAKTTLGVAVQYDIISFSLGFAPKFFAENKDNKGSKMTSFSFNLFPGRFMQHFDLYYQKGITLSVEGGGSGYFPGLKTIKIGGSTSYFFNENFSFTASAFQNAKQLRSAGSFAPVLSYYYTELNSKNEPAIGNDKVYFVDVAVAPAYYYNWVIGKNFLLSSGASLGAGFTTTVDDTTTTKLLVSGSLHLAPGYNGERWFGGLNARASFFTRSSESDVQLTDAIGYTSLFVGYRFDEPGFLNKERVKVEQKLRKPPGGK
jgi:hypothetical protein